MTRLTCIWSILFVSVVKAQIPCQDDSSCPPASKCLQDQGMCSNPMEQGCLRAILGESYPIRTCSSDDRDASGPSCRPNVFEYPEMRILSQNWQEPTFFAWVLQILLSEIANVPATIETDGHASFYDSTLQWDYADTSYDYDALRTAHQAPQNDCTGSDQPCAHVMPEVWSGQRQAWRAAEQEGLLESPVGTNGRTAKYSWYIPKFVAQEDPSLMSFYGLSGEENRQKLAQRFNRPMTWKQYCQEVSHDTCETPDETALRPPLDAAEEDRYYFEGDSDDRPTFRGYFRATLENDCNANPETCTGHIGNYECKQSTFVVAQAHWLNISLSSSGPESNGAGGYGPSAIKDLWQAANATNSSIIMYFANTNPFTLQFQGTPFEFQRILLPEPTAQCLAHRVSEEDRCSADRIRQVGSPLGSCDTDLLPLKKYVIGSLRTNTFAQPEASRSPAYDMIKAMEISTLDMLDIMKRWRNQHDNERYFGSREAVCHWVANNIEDLASRMLPATYPRERQVQSFLDGQQAVLPIVALGLGAVAVLGVLICFGLTWLWQKRKVMVYAQPEFLYLILTGLLLVSISAVLHATPPSLGSCVARQWMSTLGFSLELVPLIVKVHAINHLFKQARKMKRIKIDKLRLYKTVAAVIACVVVYLIVWTATDPPTQQSEAVLTDDVVQVVQFCASSSRYWRIASLVYLVVLLLVATVMATQSRNVQSEFKESTYLAAMIYSHFLFVLLRFLLFLFGSQVSDSNRSAVAGATSLFLSLDAMICLGIYFAPKFRLAKSQSDFDPNKTMRSLGRSNGGGSPRSSAVMERSSGHLNNSNSHVHFVVSTVDADLKDEEAAPPAKEQVSFSPRDHSNTSEWYVGESESDTS